VGSEGQGRGSLQLLAPGAAGHTVCTIPVQRPELVPGPVHREGLWHLVQQLGWRWRISTGSDADTDFDTRAHRDNGAPNIDTNRYANYSPAHGDADSNADATDRCQYWSVTATTSSSSIRKGDRVGLTAQARPNRATTVLVNLEVYDPQGRKVFQQYWDRRSFDANRTRGFSALWRTPSNAQQGTYTVKVGIFGVRWSGLEYWNDSATTFTVR
jgi:hypothetical protein